MRNLRIIARLDIKAPNLIKGIHLEGLRVVGDPQEFAIRYYQEGIDEIVYMDIVASLYNRNSLSDIVARTAEHVFVPMTVGGGVRTLDSVHSLLRAGADKVAINTAAIARPDLITEVAERYGSQCMVLSIEAKRDGHGRWEAYTDNGRERTGKDVIEWAVEGVRRGAGEIMLTSVDQEGTQKGFDIDLCRQIAEAVDRPVILSGGMGTLDHFEQAVRQGGADAVAIAHVLHYNKIPLADIRAKAKGMGMQVREV